ncbi:MAG: S-methyl-5-thioribose-1-phosphate isomerase [Lentisphaerae bacterium]|nr:S-methyl-5-thioribose-1-phosphate isomerase [Lentisphaerota bacterium]
MFETVRWHTADGRLLDAPATDGTPLLPGRVRLIDQTRLPAELVYVELESPEAMHDAIKRLVVRGAPAIGCAAALGLAAALQHDTGTPATFLARTRQVADYLAGARPTAVNLAWAIRRTLAAALAAADSRADLPALKLALIREALAILQEDIALCQSIGHHGAPLIQDGMGVLTHCNAGALATADFGTALSVFYTAHNAGRRFTVYADETRPLLQGARLTTWELHHAGIDVVAICDNMAATLMQAGRIQAVIVGADRVAANGDTANKIGTYGVAVLAHHHRIPFYVAMPYSTIDVAIADGRAIPIEERDPDEVRRVAGQLVTPPGVRVFNPAFDVTPHALIRGFVTDRGLLEPPFAPKLAAAARRP